MNARFLQFIIVASGLTALLSACNASSSSESQTAITQAESSTLVKSFELRPNYNLMANLDSVFFSIDQVKGEIFNADSLPWGTDVRKLTVQYTLASTASAEIIMPSLYSGQDTVINLVENPTDSINFSNGRVWLRVTSNNGEFERIYNVKVNVHAMNADSLQWQTDVTPLPAANPTGAQAAELNGKYYLLTENAGGTALWSAATPTAWQPVGASLPANAVVGSLRASTDALYLLSTDGRLFTSTDGSAWEEADSGWSHLYGGFQTDIVGVKGSQWVCYPSGNSGAIAADMPVANTSAMWTFTNDWAIEPQAIFVGGTKADGTLSGETWGFDGNRWMQFSDQMGTRVLPAASGMQVFPYFTFRTGSSAFMVTRQSAWIALGGRLANGTINPTVYYSLDNGINWRTAPDAMQLPTAQAPRAGAAVLLCNETFTARAIRPITQWDAPFIYLIGGTSASGTFQNQIWVGVLNRLTFKPLQ